VEQIIGAAAPASDLIKDSNSANFAADVIEASAETPVIVDFWAPWCGPCKQLGPMIEKVVAAAAGAVKLVKMNIDESPEIAQQMRIQSIPAVYAFKNGKPVDAFVGAVPESQIKDFVERLAGEIGPTPVEEAMAAAAAAVEAGDHGAAANIFGEVLKHEPGNPVAIGGLARAYLATGNLSLARDTLEIAPDDLANHADIVGARSALALAEQSGAAGDTEPLRAAVEANPADHQARFDLGMALIAAGDNDAAIDCFIEIVRRDGKWNDEAARKQLLQVFEALGPAHELTAGGRRKLSSILFS
jgi:putative thioredoxin